MNVLLRRLLDQGDGLLTWREMRQAGPVWLLEWASRAGHLRRLLPGVYVDARWARPTPELLRRAAVAWAGGRGALSHTTALDVWGLDVPSGTALPGAGSSGTGSPGTGSSAGRRASAGDARAIGMPPVHLTVPLGSGLRSRSSIVVHQRRGLVLGPPDVLHRDGAPVTRIERSLVDAWPLLPAADRPAPLIRAVNERLTTPSRVSAALAGVPKLADRARLRVLLDRLAAGCRSELEIWGHDHVFTGYGMPPFQRQARVRVGDRTFYLDVYAERERVNFELDGAASHGDVRQREIDLRRDALLASIGIQVVRYPHRRLVREPEAVRSEVLAILANRRLTLARLVRDHQDDVVDSPDR